MALYTGTTRLADLVTPQVFLAYLQRISSQTNRLILSGATAPDPIIQNQLLAPAMWYTTPALNDLSAAPQSWRDTQDIKVNSVTSGTNNGVKLYLTQSFGNTDFGQLVTGAPVASQIAARFADYWNRVDERLAIDVIENTFKDDTLKTAKSFGIGAEADLSASGFISAMARMGDVANPKLTVIIVNSGAYQQMKKLNLLDENQPQSVAGVEIGTYQGIAILTDDSIAADPTTGVTSAYIVSKGGIANNTANPANAVETFRDPTGNGGQDAVINRRVKGLQILGTTFVDPTQSANYSVEALEAANKADDGTQFWGLGTNDPRNIGVVKYSFKIDKDLIVQGINNGASDNGGAPVAPTIPAPTDVAAAPTKDGANVTAK